MQPQANHSTEVYKCSETDMADFPKRLDNLWIFLTFSGPGNSISKVQKLSKTCTNSEYTNCLIKKWYGTINQEALSLSYHSGRHWNLAVDGCYCTMFVHRQLQFYSFPKVSWGTEKHPPFVVLKPAWQWQWRQQWMPMKVKLFPAWSLYCSL